MKKQNKNRKVSNQFFVPHNILEEEKFLDMPLSAQILYIHLCRIKNRNGNKFKFFKDIRSLARMTKMNKNTVSKAKSILVENEYIGVERDCYSASGHRSADIFHLNGFKYKYNV